MAASVGEIALINVMKLLREKVSITFKDMDEIEHAFTQALDRIRELTISRDNWRKKYEEK